MIQSLASLPLGKPAEIVSVLTDSDLKHRLSDLGLTPGCPVRCIYGAACGDPRAYLVRGTVLAIRNADARGIEVRVWD
ncbi:MAG: ferrous iron transport protein A [Clostridia bacterium]|jgi:ferrous iron transport protein A|nr:ferrous iron transport protein A [Clostridia bacterium]